ncbi:hypothetical protein SANTM175S_06003 [Streptomyces antimycoticus]
MITFPYWTRPGSWWHLASSTFHSHADNAPLLAEDDTSKILQGITTEVTGNCGSSLAPVRPASAQDFASFTRRIYPQMDFTWSDWEEFTAVTDARGHVTNMAPLVGHGTLRIAVLGTAAITPDAAQMRTMCRELGARRRSIRAPAPAPGTSSASARHPR